VVVFVVVVAALPGALCPYTVGGIAGFGIRVCHEGSVAGVCWRLLLHPRI
jgi:hypothetical protein